MVFFGFKVIRSVLRNDYTKNRNKYIKKYNLIYDKN